MQINTFINDDTDCPHYSPFVPARAYGPWEDCHPEQPMELEFSVVVSGSEIDVDTLSAWDYLRVEQELISALEGE